MSDEELIAALADEYARWTAAPYVPDDWQRNNGDDLARAHLLPIVHRYADQRAVEELGEALGIGATRGPLEAAAWMARRHAALRQEVSR